MGGTHETPSVSVTGGMCSIEASLNKKTLNSKPQTTSKHQTLIPKS